jgi:putative ABC transport system permease protein
MATLRFLLKRFAAQRLLGLAVVVTLGFTVGVLVAGPIYADAARGAISSSALAGAAVTVRNARYQVYGDPTFGYPDADAALTKGIEGLPVRRVVRQGLSTVRIANTGASAPLLFRDGAETHLTFHGTPPGPGQIALTTGAANAAGAAVGDVVTIEGPTGSSLPLTVSGTFELPGAGDPFWFGSDAPFPPPDALQPAPMLVDRSTMLYAQRTLGLTVQYSWDAYLNLDGLEFAALGQIPARIQQVADGVASAPGLASLHVSSGLGTLLDLVRQRVANLRIPILLVVFQIAAVALAVLAGVGALTLTRQTFELAVLHSRGFSRPTLLAAQGVQAVIAAAIAYPVGLAIGLGLAALAGRTNGRQLPGVRFPVHLNGTALLLGVVAAFAGAVILALLSVPVVNRTVLQERRAASREERPLLARIPVELIVLPVGIFAFIQLRSSVGPTGNGTIDPLVMIAPTLLLFGASFLVLRLLLFALRRLDRRIGRTRRLPAYLAGRRLGRSPGTGFAAALLLLLSVGLLVLATSYRAIMLRNHADSAHTQVGGDWNVQATPPTQSLVALRRMPPGTTPVVRADPGLTKGSFSLPPSVLAIDPSTFAAGGWWRRDYAPTTISDILNRLRAPPLGYAPGFAFRRVTLGVSLPPGIRDLSITATAIDDGGKVVVAKPKPLHPRHQMVVLALPAPVARLMSITFQAVTGAVLPKSITVDLPSIQVERGSISPVTLEPLAWRGGTGTVRLDGASGYRYTFSPGVANVVGGLRAPTEPLPALVSPDVLAQEGPDFTMALGGQQVPVHVVATASQFPTIVPNAPFIVVSAPALLQRQLAIPEEGLNVTEVWANTPHSPVDQLRAAGFVTGEVRSTASIEAILAQLPQSLAIGMNFTAAAGGLGLVVIGVAAGLYFAQRRRDYEFAALRAMGVTPAQIRRTLVLEQSLLLGFAIVAGLGLGYLLLRVMMPYVGSSLGVPFPTPVLVFDWTALGISLLAIAAASSVALLLSVRFLMRSSVTGVLRGEAE